MDQVELNQLLEKELGDDAGRRGWVIYSGLDELRVTITLWVITLGRIRPTSLCLKRRTMPLTGVLTLSSAGKKVASHHASIWMRGRLKMREPHQNRVFELAGLLDTKPERSFSANAIFVESPEAKDLQDADRLWQKCWRVHQKFLALVRPKWIICLGNGEERSSFQLMKQRAAVPTQTVRHCDPKYRPYYRTGKWFHTSFLDIRDTSPLNVNVLGVPHPSRFTILDGLKDFIATSVRSA